MDTETDGQTDMTQLIIAFRNFAKMPKNIHKTGVTSFFINTSPSKSYHKFRILSLTDREACRYYAQDISISMHQQQRNSDFHSLCSRIM